MKIKLWCWLLSIFFRRRSRNFGETKSPSWIRRQFRRDENSSETNFFQFVSEVEPGRARIFRASSSLRYVHCWSLAILSNRNERLRITPPLKPVWTMPFAVEFFFFSYKQSNFPLGPRRAPSSPVKLKNSKAEAKTLLWILILRDRSYFWALQRLVL